MKKAVSLLLLLALVFALAGCDSVPGTGESSGGNTGYPVDGYAEGRMGDTMHSEFFDYTVNSASVVMDYNGYTPAEGNELLLVEVTILNTFNQSIPMFYNDFQAQWNEDDNEDAFSWPIEQEGLSEAQLPLEYELAVKESRTGELVFEVPAGNKDFSLSYLEAFEGDETGDTFFVYFTADRAAANA